MAIIGFGKDIHNLITSSEIVLGGTKFNLDYSIVAHSDGDVIYHALSNAILCALGLDDIGVYFSDKDPNNRHLDSENILTFALTKMQEQNYKLNNISICVTCQKVKINPIKNQIMETLTKKLTPYFKDKVLIGLHATSFEDNSNNQIMCECIISLD